MRLDPLAGDPQLTVPRPSAKQPRNFNFHSNRSLPGDVRLLLMDECVGVVREFCKEEVAMSETKRMADEANRMGQQAQEGPRERDVSSRRLPRGDLRRQAGHSPKPIKAFRPWLRK